MIEGPVVHQFTAVLSGRDAVGHHTLALDRLLRELGAVTTIYAAHVNPESKDWATHYRHHAEDAPADWIIYQASTGTPVADYLLERPEPLVVNYHNMTPSEFFYPWEPHVGTELDHGRRQLASLCARARLGIADSEFNARDLRAAGVGWVEVAPVLVDDSVLPSGDVPSSFGSGSKVTLLFVGRLAPNKCQQDLISALVVLRCWHDDVELVLLGSPSADSYQRALKDFATELGVGDSVRFVGSVSTEEMVGWYRRADVFVCLSEHEGFCVPLVEAMAWGVPVVAAAVAAVPETLGGAGLLLTDKSPVVVAAAVQRVLSDKGLREGLVRRGLVRARELGPITARQRMRDILAPLVSGTQMR